MRIRQVRPGQGLQVNRTDLTIFCPVVFLQTLQSYPPLPTSHIEILDKLYLLSKSSNAEIRLRFYEVAMQAPSSGAAKTYSPDALQWVVGTDGTGIVKGRMKFCRPVFLMASKVDQGLTVRTFRAHKTSFHPIAQKLIEKVS